MRCFLLLLLVASVTAFQQSLDPSSNRQTPSQLNGWNPLKDLSDTLSNMDDVIDDFMNKRMGNGEVFYGKRKYKPSGRPNTEGDYQGMGLSDKLRIDVTRQVKEEFQEQRRRREREE